MAIGKDVPREVALKLCDEIRAEHEQRGWFSGFPSGGLTAGAATSGLREMWRSYAYPAREAAPR